jgi:hypothetical protein
MPPLSEIRHQLAGFWLLVQGDARGLSHFDISDDGVIRSFWAWVYCMPGLILYAILRRVEFLQAGGETYRSSLIYCLQVMAVELAGWTTAILAILIAGLALGIRPLLRTLVVALNWAAVPAFTLAYGPLFGLLLLPVDNTVSWLAQMAMLLAAISLVAVVLWRMMRTVIGGSWMKRAAYLLLICLPPAYIMHSLEQSMGLVLPLG